MTRDTGRQGASVPGGSAGHTVMDTAPRPALWTCGRRAPSGSVDVWAPRPTAPRPAPRDVAFALSQSLVFHDGSSLDFLKCHSLLLFNCLLSRLNDGQSQQNIRAGCRFCLQGNHLQLVG